MAIYEVNGVRPTLGKDVWVAETASVIGDVHLGDGVGIWPGAVLRGDYYPIRIGARSNVQDNAVIHIYAGRSKTTIGEDVTIGHSAVVHGCTLAARVLVGIGAIVLDDAVVGEDTLVAAGALVTPRTVIPPRSVVMGRPGKVVRQVTDADVASIRDAASLYVGYARDFRATCKRVG
jgi:carbonic anhydrase/acetyltransferase-like protein (isoleucine patch superfamily)